MVGAEGFEPPTLCSQSRCATRLRYAPTFLVYRIGSRKHSVRKPHPVDVHSEESTEQMRKEPTE